MSLAALLALTILSAQSAAPPPDTAQPADKPVASAPAPSDDDENDGVPASAPTDDYEFVAWCYGALDESLQIYDRVKPDLKAIDKLFGTPVKEPEPYASDVAGERKALLRFAAAVKAAEKASPHPISERGLNAIAEGRRIWSAAELQPSRKLADAWLFWGVPHKCETVAAKLHSRSVLMGPAFARPEPKADDAAAPDKPKAAPTDAPVDKDAPAPVDAAKPDDAPAAPQKPQ
jgi:hypothetical protein